MNNSKSSHMAIRKSSRNTEGKTISLSFRILLNIVEKKISVKYQGVLTDNKYWLQMYNW